LARGFFNIEKRRGFPGGPSEKIHCDNLYGFWKKTKRRGAGKNALNGQEIRPGIVVKKGEKGDFLRQKG